MSFFACPGSSSANKRLEPVHGLDPPPAEGFAPVGQHPQGLELTVEGQDPQACGAHGDHRDGVRVVGVGLAVVPGVEEPDPGGELGGDVDDVLAGLEQPLCQRPAGAVGALDRPRPSRPRLDVRQHRRVPGPVGGEPALSELAFVVVDDLDRRRQLVGIDPDDDAFHALAPACARTDVDGEVGSATTSRAVPS